MFYSNQLLILFILLPIFCKPFFHSVVPQQEQTGKEGGKIKLKPVNTILLLAIVTGLLREKIEAICKMSFVCLWISIIHVISLFPGIIKNWLNLKLFLF